jgi:hypothetical protein
MGKIIFAYRLAHDKGFAPCVDNGVLTLACCKGGQIRNNKDVITGLRYHIYEYREQNPGDEIYVLGIYKNKLLYYALVTSVMTMIDYFSPEKKVIFGNRNDHIYDSKNDKLIRNNIHPKIHPKGDPQNAKDANGKYVIVSDDFTYFGNSAEAMPNGILDLLPKFRETKRYKESDGDFASIHEFAMQTRGSLKGVVDKPHDAAEEVKCWR